MNGGQAAGSVDQVRTAGMLGNTLKNVLTLPNNVLSALQSGLSAPDTKGRDGFVGSANSWFPC